MDTPGYVILSRLGAQLRATQVLANNLANAETPGFRAGRAVFAQYLDRQREGGAVAYAQERATWRDTATPGPLSTTGNHLTHLVAMTVTNSHQRAQFHQAVTLDHVVAELAEQQVILGTAGDVVVAMARAAGRLV